MLVTTSLFVCLFAYLFMLFLPRPYICYHHGYQSPSILSIRSHVLQEEVVIRILEASFQSIPNPSSLFPSTTTPSTTAQTEEASKSSTTLSRIRSMFESSTITSSTIGGTNVTHTLIRPNRYKVRGLLASPASVNVSLYLDNFQRLMIGGFKSVQLWYCQEQIHTATAVDSSRESCVFVPDRKVQTTHSPFLYYLTLFYLYCNLKIIQPSLTQLNPNCII